MIKILLLIVSLMGLSLVSVSGVYAATQKVIVSEKVPGADCVPYNSSTTQTFDDGTSLTITTGGNGTTTTSATELGDNDTINPGSSQTTSSIYTRKYECTVEKGLAGFQKMFATIIRWFINIVMLSGVLAIVGVGIAWSLAGGDDAKAKSELKKWGINILVGMIILFFFRYILQFLAPWIYK